MIYRGWWITYDPSRPKTGLWSCVKFGVRLSAGTEEGLMRMIDARAKDTSLNVR